MNKIQYLKSLSDEDCALSVASTIIGMLIHFGEMDEGCESEIHSLKDELLRELTPDDESAIKDGLALLKEPVDHYEYGTEYDDFDI